ncbi:MAG: DUF748 domain-containing protein [Myxococcales bacterium]|nr:DUF748 domain-containing protein [Myxococcales bacterium]
MSEPPDAPSPSPRRRRLLVALGVVVVLALVFRIALPYVLAWGIGYGAESQLGLAAQVRNVDLSLFAGSVAIEGLTVAPPGRLGPDGPPPEPAEALLALERVHANLQWTRLLRGEVRLAELGLVSPSVRLERQPDGTIDPLAGAVKPADAESEEELDAPLEEVAEEVEAVEASGEEANEAIEEEEGGGWPVFLDRFDLTDAAIRVVDAADGGQVGEFNLEALELSELAFVDGAVGLGGIQIRSPSLEVDRDRALAEPTAPPPPAEEASLEEDASSTPEEPEADAPPGHRVDHLEIERAEFKLLVGTQALDVALQLEADQVSIDPGVHFPVKLGLGIANGQIDVEGQAAIVPASFHGSAKWNNLPIPLVAMAALPELQEWLTSFRSSGDADIQFDVHGSTAESGEPGLRARIGLSLDDVVAANPGNEEVAVAWKKLAVVMKEVVVPMGDAAASQPVRVHLAKVSLVEPDIHYTLPAPSLDALLGGDAEGADEGAGEGDAPAETEAAAEVSVADSSAAPAPQILIDRVEVRGGALRFDDNNVSPAFSIEIRDLEVEAGSIALPAATVGSLSANATLTGGSKLVVTGHLGAEDGKIDIDLKRFDLPPANPYAAAADLEIDRGALTLDSEVSADGPRWDIESQVTLHELQLNKQGSSGFLDQLGMPIDVVLAVLRDPVGNISLPVSVAFEEGAVETDLLEIVMGALRQALVGAASIPLKGLGAVLGGGGEISFDPIAFTPGIATPTEQNPERIAAVADLLEGQPGLDVTLSGRAGPEDRDLLALEILAERLDAGEGLPALDDVSEEGPGFFARRGIESAIKKRARGETHQLDKEREALFARYRDAVEVPDERYTALAESRARVAQQALIASDRVPEGRIQVLAPSVPGAPGVVLSFVGGAEG